MITVEVVFDNPEKAAAFMTWLCELGEQDYFTHVDETNVAGVTRFDYQWKHYRIIGGGDYHENKQKIRSV